MHAVCPEPESERGFSLVEILTVVSVLALITAAVGTIMLSSQRAFSDETTGFRVRETGRRCMNRLSALLPAADGDSITPLVLVNSNTISFNPVIGHDGTNFILGPKVNIWHELAASETLNGQDDNGDGRADEGSLQFQEGDSPPVTVAGDIVSVNFDGTSNGVIFTVIVAIVGPNGVQQKTFSRRVSFRNID